MEGVVEIERLRNGEHVPLLPEIFLRQKWNVGDLPTSRPGFGQKFDKIATGRKEIQSRRTRFEGMKHGEEEI